MIIGGLQKSSLIDFPEKISAIIFTQGCNFCCGYCHNPELLKTKETTFSLEDIYNFLETRKAKLDGVVITGGEPTLHKDLKNVVQKIKNMDYAVKLDTNGTNPKMLKELMQKDLLDYIAMDIKAPLDKYDKVTGVNVDTQKIKDSIDLIKSSNVEYEFRTTVLKCFLSINDIYDIGNTIKGAKKYYLQKFLATKPYNESLKDENNYTDDEFECIIKELRSKIKFVGLR